ncbi:transposon-transfer assisting family protein [Proteiniclasticum ruminis]|uniref:transposon-transfer assisting family protein n=1 Tax=Proteiniclasticum ruminis TaxID=398199 RepID=UPI0028B25CC4|nr:transposon-transfer assisting family protein [Proteiniclasticum ruminis]
MEKFTMEECNLMCIYDTGTKDGLLAELTAMQAHLQPDEAELLELTHRVMDKLTAMTDEEYREITAELIADFEEQEDYYANKNTSLSTDGRTNR